MTIIVLDLLEFDVIFGAVGMQLVISFSLTPNRQFSNLIFSFIYFVALQY